MRIHLAAEHALEFEAAHPRLDLAAASRSMLRDGGRVVLALGQFQQLERVDHTAICAAIQLPQLGGQPRALAAQLLRPLRLVPDVGHPRARALTSSRRSRLPS